MTQTPDPKSRIPNPEPRVAGIRFQPMGKVYHFDASARQDLQPGDFVIVETARGKQLGEVVGVWPSREGDDSCAGCEEDKTGLYSVFGDVSAMNHHWGSSSVSTPGNYWIIDFQNAGIVVQNYAVGMNARRLK